MTLPRKVLFVCIGNTCRSQMAEALARHLHSDVIAATSAGVSPFGRVVDPTRTVLLERGVSIGSQYSKGLRQAPAEAADLVVNMSGLPSASLFPGSRVLDWDVGDPYGEDLSVYREICDTIEAHLRELAAQLRRESIADRATN